MAQCVQPDQLVALEVPAASHVLASRVQLTPPLTPPHGVGSARCPYRVVAPGEEPASGHVEVIGGERERTSQPGREPSQPRFSSGFPFARQRRRLLSRQFIPEQHSHARILSPPRASARKLSKHGPSDPAGRCVRSRRVTDQHRKASIERAVSLRWARLPRSRTPLPMRAEQEPASTSQRDGTDSTTRGETKRPTKSTNRALEPSRPTQPQHHAGIGAKLRGTERHVRGVRVSPRGGNGTDALLSAAGATAGRGGSPVGVRR